MHDAIVALFLATAGLTASGIVANIYRLVARAHSAVTVKPVYFAVMAVAGPSVLFDNAARSRSKNECSIFVFGMAAAFALYWSLAIGLLIVELASTL